MDKEDKTPEGKTNMTLEGMARTTGTVTTKRETRGKSEVEINKMKPGKTPDHATSKPLRYNDKKKKYGTFGKIIPIHQENQAEEA